MELHSRVNESNQSTTFWSLVELYVNKVIVLALKPTC